MKRAFLDSGIFIAALDRSDRWHRDAAALFASGRVRWCSSLLVVSETYSWFLHRLGEEPARTFRRFIRELDGLELFEATRAHHAAVLKMLDKLRGTKLTYVDASSLVHLDAHRIDTVWGTDHHLALNGARVVPHGR